jgi:hypothetical protein
MLKQMWRSRPIKAAIVFALVCHSFDIISTVLATRVGAFETNPWMRDAQMHFVLWDGIVVKLAALLMAFIPTVCLFWGEQDQPSMWAPIPLYLTAWSSLLAALNNFFIYWKG